ncbi:MAG: glucodextranase DOMON-like domain-containing protein [Candidatus Hodarchaeota archaeon]
MRKKFVGMLLICLVLALLTITPNNIAALPIESKLVVVSDPSWNDVTIDGAIGADWFDGNFTFTPDADDDARTDPTQGKLTSDLSGLYVAVNDTGIAIGLNATTTADANGYLVFIDIDQGGHGSPDHSLGSQWTRKAKFMNGFRPDYFFGGWGSANWDLFNYTDDVGSTAWVDPVAGYITSTGTVSTVIYHEGFIEWSMLYPTLNSTHPIPTNAEIWLVAIAYGDDTFLNKEPADLLPESYLPDTTEEVNNYIVIELDKDGNMVPALVPEPTVGWSGNEADNSFNGIMPMGMTLEIEYSVYWNGVNDHPNVTYQPLVKYRAYDNTTGTWGSEQSLVMVHKAGDYQGANDWHRIAFDTSVLEEDDIIEWYCSSSFGDTAKHNVTIGALPPVYTDYIGNINPSGGFVLPGNIVNITVQVEQYLIGPNNSRIYLHKLPSSAINVTLYYETTASPGTWTQVDMEFDMTADQNDQYKTAIGSYAEGTNITFYIKATGTGNSTQTGNTTIFILTPPPESQIFTMLDPEGDEYGVLPVNALFFEGIHDILNFTVTGNDWQTTFWFKMQNVTDPGWGAGYFSMPLFAVMLDTATGGSTDSFGNAYVTTETGWEYGFKIDGWKQVYYTPATLATPQETGTGISVGTQLDFGTDNYWLYFSVPTSLTGGKATSSWAYYAMVGNGDYNMFRAHNAAAAEWNYGGGVDGDVDPNYNDLLVPSGGNSTAVQEFITNGYDVASQTRAEILRVGPGISFVADTTPPTLTITSPANNTSYNLTDTTVSVTVQWTVSDPADATFSGMDKLELFVDGVIDTSVQLGDTSFTTSLGAGNHKITINAYDITGNVRSVSLFLTVNAASSVAPTTTPGFELIAIMGGIVALTAIIIHRKKKK